MNIKITTTQIVLISDELIGNAIVLVFDKFYKIGQIWRKVIYAGGASSEHGKANFC